MTARDEQNRLDYRHQKVQRLRKLLRKRSSRLSERVFVAEGAKLLEEAVAAGSRVEAVFIAPDAMNEAEQRIVEQVLESGVRVHQLRSGVMERVADTVTPQSVVAIVEALDRAVVEIFTGGPVIVLVDVRDPGNAGTVLRSAEAAGLAGVVLTEGAVDIYNPKTVRSSAGALFHVPFAVGVAVEDLLRVAQAADYRVLATAMTGGTEYTSAELTGAVALAFGNEANGLPMEIMTRLDETVSIPIAGRSESLNVSMAASILSFESARQQRLRIGASS